jgi:hypothetical protein
MRQVIEWLMEQQLLIYLGGKNIMTESCSEVNFISWSFYFDVE